MRRVKGAVQYAVLTVLWIIGFVLLVASISIALPWFNPFGASALSNTAVIKTDVYMMDSAIDAAQAYLAAGLQYSNYQACYGLMKAGAALPAREEFAESLRAKIEKNLNAYATLGYVFFQKYAVNIPEYSVAVTASADGTEATATSGGKLSSSSDFVTAYSEGKENIRGKAAVYRKYDFKARLNFDCLVFFDEAKAAGDGLKAKLDKALADTVKSMESGIARGAGTECLKALEEERDGLLDTMGSEPGVAEVTGLELNMRLLTPIEPDSDGKYLCRFARAGESGYSVKAEIESAENVPVDNGDGLKFEKVAAVFVVEGSA